MSRPNAAQIRLLSVLALKPGTRFVDLVQIEQARQVRSGDDLFVPSLVARGWAELGPQRECSVRITEAGRFVLADLGDGGAGIRFRERKG
jgi:hypothetical protein